MCKCTPGVRTPFCGAKGCEWPPQRIAMLEAERGPGLKPEPAPITCDMGEYYE